ncbi:molecular chaperone DnaJ [Caballeronia catudaia]|uniref:Molecular chaperone DnaJ n=1 Tax=Caballeronia catudaia TaxID=1777136 RepID=A0A158C3T9_9BURK|nr:J domain-containing protein [Caballeronia catudaia]SAK76992.1 molecular chaperone DnaJ [Caballeronia catudaia]
MTRTNLRSVSIALDHDKPALSRGQKGFNSLIKQIDKRRKQLRAWETVTPTFQQRYVSEFLPLECTSTTLQIRMVHFLDQAYVQKELTKAERRKMGIVITHLAGNLIDEDEDEGKELKAIYDKYSPTDYDSQMAAEVDGMKSMLETVLGVELGDDLDLSSPEELLQRAQAHIQQGQVEAAEKQAERDVQRAKRKKSPRQQAAEARAQEQQAQMSLSMREVYRRKLASTLHPDRETDPQERHRKTRLMQRVNEAYQKNNLLQLLELQLELEHIDQHALSSMSDERLKHYNTILKEQVRELDQEILHVECAFRYTYGIDPIEPVSPDTVLRNLAVDLKELRLNVRTLEHDLAAFEDIKNLKRWLKDIQVMRAASTFDAMRF